MLCFHLENDDTDDDTLIQLRCTAHPSNLDEDEHAVRRSRDHTAILTSYIELPKLWDGFGIVGDTIASDLVFRICAFEY